MFTAAPIMGSGPSVRLISATPDPLGAVAAMCKMYKGQPTYDLADITDDERRHYWEESKKTHLKAPLEAIDLHFFIEGVDRAFTHQIVRQRTAVFAQESMRFAVKENLAKEVAVPDSIPAEEIGTWFNAIQDVQDAYDRLIASGVPAEDARGLLPAATPTRLHYKTNLRNLLDHAGNRLCTQAQFVWRIVIAKIVDSIREHEPPSWFDGRVGGLDPLADTSWQFRLIADDDVFKPVCFALGKCPFTADFDRPCTIRDRVQEGRFDEIKPEEWLADPTAARGEKR
jgi:thymidylate synthase (FAD)